MTTFSQLQLVDGDMPVLHIGEVVAVSFTEPEMAVKLISKFPAVELPSAPPPIVIVQVYYRSGVPIQGLPLPEPFIIPCQVVSARYFMVAEKVIVIQNGLNYYVVGSIRPPYSNRLSTGREIGRENSFNMMDGASAAPISAYNQDGRVVMLEDLSVLEVSPLDTWGYNLPDFWESNLFRGNWRLPQSSVFGHMLNRSYPLNVGICPSIRNLPNWTWDRGSYNGYWSSHSFAKQPSCLLPTPSPAVRVEFQPAQHDPVHSVYNDFLPDLEIFTTPSDLGYGLNCWNRDFVNIDDYFKLLFTIARPWGTVPSNPNNWRTQNWTPNVLLCPAIIGDVYKMYYGFYDYKKDDYDAADRFYTGNIYHYVSGEVSATIKPEAVGKTLFSVNDFLFSHSSVSEELTSEYDLYINNTGTGNPPVEGNINTWIQTVTMNETLEPIQEFMVCTDGLYTLKKKPILTWVDYKSVIYGPGDVPESNGVHKQLSLEIIHSVNGVPCFTSSFNIYYDLDNPGLDPSDPESEIWNQRYYYIYQIDLPNKLFLCEVYIRDYATGDQHIERVVVDGVSGTEHIIWSYTPTDQQDGSVTNFPPWLDYEFPEHPKDAGFTGDEDIAHTGKIWKSPFFSGLDFDLSIAGEGCLQGGQPPAADGIFYPTAALDEDIRSVALMMGGLFLFNKTGKPSDSILQDIRDFGWVKKRKDGWLAYSRCCYDADKGVLDFPEGSDIIKKVSGVVTGADELYNAPDEVVNTYY